MTALLYRRREIVKGSDTLRRFLVGMIADDSVVMLRVRGVQSECECGATEICERCRTAHPVALKIAGTVDTELERKGFGFIGYLALNQHRDALRHFRIDPNDEIRIPSMFQLVFGANRDDWPHLIGPLEGTLDHAMDRLLGIGRHKPEPKLPDGVWRVYNFEELVRAIACNEQGVIHLWDNHMIVGIHSQRPTEPNFSNPNPTLPESDHLELGKAVWSMLYHGPERDVATDIHIVTGSGNNISNTVWRIEHEDMLERFFCGSSEGPTTRP